MQVWEQSFRIYSILQQKNISIESHIFYLGSGKYFVTYLETKYQTCYHMVYQQEVLGTYNLVFLPPRKGRNIVVRTQSHLYKKDKKKFDYLQKMPDHQKSIFLQAQSHLHY
jgi:hypothetical protein